MTRLALTIALLLLTANGPAIPPFSLDHIVDGRPEGWKALTFPSISRHTDYRLMEHQGKVAVKAFADKSASALYTEIDAPADGRLSWAWKVIAPVEGANVAHKERDDAAARVYILFAYDPDKADLWTAAKYGAVKLLYGEYPPAATITYIWSRRQPVDVPIESPYASASRIVALRKGSPAHDGWFTESVDPGDDFRRIFHEEPPRIAGIGIMTDSDNTGGVATAWFADFTLTPKEGTTP